MQNPLNDAYPETVYKTGDLVRLNEFGEIMYITRKDFQIKHMGYRIELGEIETAAASMEKCRNVPAFIAIKQTELLSITAQRKQMKPQCSRISAQSCRLILFPIFALNSSKCRIIKTVR